MTRKRPGDVGSMMRQQAAVSKLIGIQGDIEDLLAAELRGGREAVLFPEHITELQASLKRFAEVVRSLQQSGNVYFSFEEGG
ncbi:MAG: hypothetical protein H0X25_13490 [Acidobacteriales bacterium]|nr:hypothetical protein [Terriglobales bacterium]